MKLKSPKITAKIMTHPHFVLDDGEGYLDGNYETVVVLMDFGDGIGRTIDYLAPKNRTKKKVDELLEQYKKFATNVGASFKRDYTAEELDGMLDEAAESEE